MIVSDTLGVINGETLDHLMSGPIDKVVQKFEAMIKDLTVYYPYYSNLRIENRGKFDEEIRYVVRGDREEGPEEAAERIRKQQLNEQRERNLLAQLKAKYEGA
jgi:hypothetical protein